MVRQESDPILPLAPIPAPAEGAEPKRTSRFATEESARRLTRGNSGIVGSRSSAGGSVKGRVLLHSDSPSSVLGAAYSTLDTDRTSASSDKTVSSVIRISSLAHAADAAVEAVPVPPSL